MICSSEQQEASLDLGKLKLWILRILSHVRVSHVRAARKNLRLFGKSVHMLTEGGVLTLPRRKSTKTYFILLRFSKFSVMQRSYLLTLMLSFCFVISGCASGAVPSLITYNHHDTPYDFAKQNNLNYYCVKQIFGHVRPPSNSFAILKTPNRKSKRLAEKALQECDLNDFTTEYDLDYECAKSLIFSLRTRVFESEEIHALKQENKALKECRLNTDKEK